MANGAETAGGAERAGGRVRLPGVLRLFWAGSVAAFGLMLLIAYVECRMGLSHWHYNPLSGDRYQDLMEFPPVYRTLHTAAFFDGVGNSRVAYPPFGAVVYALIYGTGHPIVFYLGTAALWLAAGVWGMRRELMAEGIRAATAMLFPLTIALVSFPIAGLLQRGNVELYLWILAATGTWAFLRGRENAAAVLWGLAAAMKLYPVLFLALLLPRGRWRALAVGIGTFVGTTVLSMVWLGPSMAVAWQGSLRNVFRYQVKRASDWNLHELFANHTAYDLTKVVALIARFPLAKLTAPYYVCGALLLLVSFFGKLWKMPVANQLLAISAFMMAFPPVSYFYTLVQLYAAWMVLVFVAIRAEKAGVTLPGLRMVMLLFVGLFGSFMLFSFPRVFLYGGLIQGIMLVLLFLCALEYPFRVETSKA
jgi:hypothetical protein